MESGSKIFKLYHITIVNPLDSCESLLEFANQHIHPNNKININCTQDPLFRFSLFLFFILSFGYLLNQVSKLNFNSFLFSNFLIMIFLKIIIGASFFMALLCWLSPFSLNPLNGLGAILYETGIWIRHVGFSSWDNIQNLYVDPKQSNEGNSSICITFKNCEPMIKQADFDCKLKIMWPQRFGTCHVRLIDIAIPTDEIIAFAHHAMQASEKII